MIDPAVAGLARDVIAGRLSAGGPLLDRLAETSDHRFHLLARLLGRLAEAARRLAGERQGRGWRRMDPEERAHRLNRSQRRCWAVFDEAFRGLFWAELAGLPPAEALAQAELELESAKQAERLAHPGPDEKGSPEEGGEENDEEDYMDKAQSMRFFGPG